METTWLTTVFKKFKEILTNKQLAATICIAWALLHLTACFPAQFIQLRAYCHKHMHWVDAIGILATASLLVHLITPLYTFIKQTLRCTWLRHLAKKEIKRILQTPGSQGHALLTRLYHEPDTMLNPRAPLTILLTSTAVISPTACYMNANPTTGIYTCPYQLTRYARQYMETYWQHLPKRRSKHIRLMLFLARSLKTRRKTGTPSNAPNSTSSK
ncbi:MAG: hypothetical protein IKV92_03235 [Akkermansia sp.]|nr:hypothetical protein [Akkermansia sp.]